jgi:hypothetical protein
LNVDFILSHNVTETEHQSTVIDKKTPRKGINFCALPVLFPFNMLRQTKMDFLLGNQRRTRRKNLGMFVTVYDNAIRDQIDKLTSGIRKIYNLDQLKQRSDIQQFFFSLSLPRLL